MHMSAITKKDLGSLEARLTKKIDAQGIDLRKEMQEQGVVLRKEMKQQSLDLRKEIRAATDDVLEVIQQLANTTHKQLEEIRADIELIKLDLGMVKRAVNNLNSDIDKAFKNKTITEEETVALMAGQKRLERWIEQIARETGIKLSA